jgi:hypothetical protein
MTSSRRRRIGAASALAAVGMSLAIASPAAAADPTITTPGEYPLQTGQTSVTVHFYDRSTNEDGFFVRENVRGVWVDLVRIHTADKAGTGKDYSFVDTDTSMSGQCYVVTAYVDASSGPLPRSAPSPEQCTVRPDPSRFPQNLTDGFREWSGLSSTNDGTGTLENTRLSPPAHLVNQHQTFGPDLEWQSAPSLWKVEAPAGSVVMKGEAVALRVWGGGWLKYSDNIWGIELALSDTPSYEWYILGGVPGEPLNRSPNGDTSFAIWNSVRKDFLVRWQREFGVDLDWHCQMTIGGC